MKSKLFRLKNADDNKNELLINWVAFPVYFLSLTFAQVFNFNKLIDQVRFYANDYMNVLDLH